MNNIPRKGNFVSLHFSTESYRQEPWYKSPSRDEVLVHICVVMKTDGAFGCFLNADHAASDVCCIQRGNHKNMGAMGLESYFIFPRAYRSSCCLFVDFVGLPTSD